MLFKKVFRDIKLNKSQFVTIFLMVFLGVFVFAGVHSYMDGMKISAENYYEECNLQDLWLTGSNFTEEDLEEVKNTDNVKNAERMLEITTSIKDLDANLDTIFIETNEISKMYVADGVAFDGESGIWIDKYLADNQDLKVGDTITITYEEYEITEVIRGLVYTPDHVYNVESEASVFPDHENYGYAYLSVIEFPEEYIYDNLKEQTGLDDIELIKNYIEDFDISDYYIFNQIIVDVEDTNKIDTVKMNLTENIESITAILERDDNTSYAGYKSEAEEGETYSVVFTLLFVFIAILSVITTMNRFIKRERPQIGTLKALGFKDRKITRVYLSYCVYISIIAVILGIVLGGLLLGNFFLNMEMEYYEIPNYKIEIQPVVYGVSIGIFALIVIVSYVSCKKILRENVSDALRLEVPKVKKMDFNLTTKGIFKNSKLSTKWNLRDISRNKGRTITAILGIAGSCMLIVCAFGFRDTLDYWINLEYETVMSFQNKIVLTDDYSDEDYDKLVNLYGDKTSETVAVELKNGDSTEVNMITVNDADGLLNNIDENDNITELENGVNITRKLAESLNVEVGDKISFRIYGSATWYEEEVTKIIKDAQSQQIYMNKESYEKLGLTYKADSIYTIEDVDSSVSGISTVQSISELRTGMESMLTVMSSIIVIFILASVVLGIVIIYNLGILSFSEKNYQFATLKVLGFKDKQIKEIFVKQNIWITIVAIAIGLPLGYILIDYVYTHAVGDTFDFKVVVGIVSYLYAIIGTTIVSFVVNKFLARKVNTIDMVTSLKGNE